MPLVVGDQVMNRPPEPVPSEEYLREQALNALKIKAPKDYRQMKRDGEMAEYLDLKVQAVQRYAKGLIETGMDEALAWKEAMYEEIIQSQA